jgi:hypothetical protein
MKTLENSLGPIAKIQLGSLGLMWGQGQHILVSGGTGSGKTLLARKIVDERLKRGGHVVLLFGKLKPDDTITEFYSDFRRWKTWRRRPSVLERKILLWPDVEGLELRDAVEEMHRVFLDALTQIGKTGDWTVVIDDGLFITAPSFLNLGNLVAMMHMLIRSANGTLLTLVQRPAHVPVSIYPNISYAFIGRASEVNDVKRLSELGGRGGSRELARQIGNNGTHDFTWIRVGTDYHNEQVNLTR